MPHHVSHDPETAFRILEVAVLDTGFDDIQGCGDDQRGRGTGDRGHEVLEPAGFVVVFEMVDELFCKG